MSVTIRSLQREDYEQATELYNLIDPAHIQVANDWREHDEGAKSKTHSRRRWVAIDNAMRRVIAYASFWHMRRQKFRMDLMVHPLWRRRGLGGELFDRLIDALQSEQAGTVQARAWDDWAESLQFLERRNFVEVHRMYELRLNNLAEADFSRFANLIERIKAQGITVTTFEKEEAKDARVWEKLTQLQNAVGPDWPDPDPDGITEPLTVEEFQKTFAAWQVLTEAFYIAQAGERYIGFSGLGPDSFRADSEAVVGSGPTAVRPEYCGQGVATMLKVLALSYARQHGFTVAASRSANPAMIRVNEKLGFERGRGEVRLVRKL
ncbi:MAG: GNAT family N-acetyltransferase, partial [Pyrinomonadaceae bacterium]